MQATAQSAARRSRGRRGGRRSQRPRSRGRSAHDGSPYGARRAANATSSSDTRRSSGMDEYDDDDVQDSTFFLSDPQFVAPAAQGSRSSRAATRTGGRVQYEEEWMFDSLAEQLARQEQQSAEEEDEQEQEEYDYEADFESRYYFSDDDDMSDSMYFAQIHMLEEEARAAARAQREARKPPARAAPTTVSRVPLRTTVPEPALCRFFVLGKCRYGSHCTYSHTLPDGARDCAVTTEEGLSAAAALVDCPFFQRGNCKYGDFCRLRHATGSSTSRAAENRTATNERTASNQASATGATVSSTDDGNQQEFTCGICFEDIVQSGKHFGLLACDHCYCLDCLRSWRQSKGMEAEVIRACPACRQPSDFVVPSLTFCTGEAKTQVVEAYKQHLSQRECKYFNASRPPQAVRQVTPRI